MSKYYSPKRLSSESKQLLRLLADGQWHLYDEIKEELMRLVPPGKAWRNYQLREEARVARHGPRTRGEPDQAEQIRSGQLTLATQAFNSMGHSYIEFKDEGGLLGERYVRLRPEHHGTLVEPDPHDEPPPPAPAPPPQAGERTELHLPDAVLVQIRDVLADEIVAALDALEVNMRAYLDQRFEELEKAGRRRRNVHHDQRPHHQRNNGKGV